MTCRPLRPAGSSVWRRPPSVRWKARSARSRSVSGQISSSASSLATPRSPRSNRNAKSACACLVPAFSPPQRWMRSSPRSTRSVPSANTRRPGGADARCSRATWRVDAVESSSARSCDRSVSASTCSSSRRTGPQGRRQISRRQSDQLFVPMAEVRSRTQPARGAARRPASPPSTSGTRVTPGPSGSAPSDAAIEPSAEPPALRRGRGRGSAGSAPAGRRHRRPGRSGTTGPGREAAADGRSLRGDRSRRRARTRIAAGS